MAFDVAAETSTTGGVTPLETPPFTIANVADRALTVEVHDRNNGSITAVSAAGGTPSSLGTPVTNGATRVSVYQLIAPSTGSQTASITGNGSYGDNAQIVLGVKVFNGVDQTTPFADYTTATGTDTTPTVTVPNVVSTDIVSDACCHRNLDGSVGANQTERYRELSFGGGSTQAGADGGVMSWASSESLAWSIAGWRVVAAATGTTITPGAGTLTLAGQTPALAATMPVAAGTLTLSGQASVLASVLPVGAGALTLSGQTPTLALSGNLSIAVPVGSLSLTGLAPTLASTMPVGAGALTLTGTTAVLARGIAVPAGTLTFTGQSIALAFLGPAAGTLTLTGYAPALGFGYLIGAGTLTLTGHAPTLSVNGTGTAIGVGAGALALTGYAPGLAFGIAPAAGTLTLSGQTPGLGFGVPVAAGTLTLQGLTPNTGSGLIISVPVGTLSLTGNTMSLGFGVAVPAGALTLEGHASTVIGPTIRRVKATGRYRRTVNVIGRTV